MPLFRVMCYRDGVWDLLEPQVVEANNARQAAEKVCGGVVVEVGGQEIIGLPEGLAPPAAG
jgi:hypothetical protein